MSVALSAIVDAALADSPAEGVALGIVDGDAAAFVCRGSVLGVAVAPDTVMYGASVTKQMVGLLLALSVEAGLASLDDPVRDGCPSCPGGSTPFACIISFITLPTCQTWRHHRTGYR